MVSMAILQRYASTDGPLPKGTGRAAKARSGSLRYCAFMSDRVQDTSSSLSNRQCMEHVRLADEWWSSA